MGELLQISTVPAKLDREMIHDFLCNQSYWAKGRSFETVEKSINNSLCFGVYQNNNQIGFARVVTDYAIFAWFMDLFILPSHQGKGYGKLLIQEIVKNPLLKEVTKWGLMTKDAQGLYKQFGFDNHSTPEMFMVKGN